MPFGMVSGVGRAMGVLDGVVIVEVVLGGHSPLQAFHVRYFVFVVCPAVPMHLQSFLSSIASYLSNAAYFNLPHVHLEPPLG